MIVHAKYIHLIILDLQIRVSDETIILLLNENICCGYAFGHKKDMFYIKVTTDTWAIVSPK